MNIGLMQLANSPTRSTPKANSVGQTKSAASTQTITSKNNSFGDVFSKVIASSNNKTSSSEKVIEDVDLEKLALALNAQSTEEVFDLLGISHDEGLLMIQTAEDGQAIAIDELMNLNDLLAVLNIDPNQLLDTLQQLLGNANSESTDLWELVNSVVEQAPVLIQQLLTALQGESKITPKHAEQLIQFLKLTQVSGKNSDLLNNQTVALSQLNDLLKTVAEEIQLVSNKFNQTSSTVTATSGKVSMHEFQQVIKQVVEKTETADSNQNPVATTTTTSTKTFTITLPIEKGAQSEVLTKEIQNLINRSQMSNTQGTMKLLLKLYPENLGSIRIELLQKDGVLTARLLTTTSMGKELLDSQLHQLKSAFAQQNIQMDRIDIAQSLQETDRNTRDQNSFGNLFKQQQPEKEENDEAEQENTEKMTFSDYLINEEV